MEIHLLLSMPVPPLWKTMSRSSRTTSPTSCCPWSGSSMTSSLAQPEQHSMEARHRNVHASTRTVQALHRQLGLSQSMASSNTTRAHLPVAQQASVASNTECSSHHANHVTAAHVLNFAACAAENPFYPLMITDEPSDDHHTPTSSSNPPRLLPQLRVLAPDRDLTALDEFKLPWSNPDNFQQYDVTSPT